MPKENMPEERETVGEEEGGVVESGLGDLFLGKVFDEFYDWAKGRIDEYFKDRQAQKFLKGEFKYMLTNYSKERSFLFRDDLIGMLHKRLRYPRKYDFGLLFGNVIGKGNVLKGVEDYEVSAFIPLEKIEYIAKQNHKRCKNVRKKERLGRVLLSCKVLRGFIENTPSCKDANYEKTVALAAKSISEILWYLFFGVEYQEVLFIGTRRLKYMAARKGSETMAKFDELYGLIMKNKRLPGPKREMEKFQRELFFDRFLGFYAMSPELEDVGRMRAKESIAVAREGRIIRMMDSIDSIPRDDIHIIKNEFMRFFQIVTITLEVLFRDFAEDKINPGGELDGFVRDVTMKMRLEEVKKRLNIMKHWRDGKKYNPLFMVFFPMGKGADAGLLETVIHRCICFVDEMEQSVKEFHLVRLPYSGKVPKGRAKAAAKKFQKQHGIRV